MYKKQAVFMYTFCVLWVASTFAILQSPVPSFFLSWIVISVYTVCIVLLNHVLVLSSHRFKPGPASPLIIYANIYSFIIFTIVSYAAKKALLFCLSTLNHKYLPSSSVVTIRDSFVLASNLGWKSLWTALFKLVNLFTWDFKVCHKIVLPSVLDKLFI